MADGRWPNDQDILAYFTRLTRSINHRAISEIRSNAKHAAIKAATADELEAFIASWPEVDPETGLSLRGDQLLIKAREAMISAVHPFNSAGLVFRAELFIVCRHRVDLPDARLVQTRHPFTQSSRPMSSVA